MFFAQSSHLTPDRECLSVLQIFMISFTIWWSVGALNSSHSRPLLHRHFNCLQNLQVYKNSSFFTVTNSWNERQSSGQQIAIQWLHCKEFWHHLRPHWRQCWMRKHVVLTLVLTPDICCLVKHDYYGLYIRLSFTLHSISEQTFGQSFTKMFWD